jgi:hypothetical protein
LAVHNFLFYAKAMAEHVVLLDDLDGSQIADGEGGKVTFALNEVSYALDLGKNNQKMLADALAPFIEVATKVEPRLAETDPEVTRLHRLARERKAAGRSTIIYAKEARDFLQHNGIVPNQKGPLRPEFWRKFREICGFDTEF